MDNLTVADSDEPNTGVQGGEPLLYWTESKLLIEAPTRQPQSQSERSRRTISAWRVSTTQRRVKLLITSACYTFLT